LSLSHSQNKYEILGSLANATDYRINLGQSSDILDQIDCRVCKADVCSRFYALNYLFIYYYSKLFYRIVSYSAPL